MKSLWLTAAVAAAALLLGGCPYHKREPLPGPQSPAGAATLGGLVHGAPQKHVVDPINWFQGTLDEAFSGHRCAVQPRHWRS